MSKILFVASEATPFVKTGGLADVIGSLPRAIQEASEHEVRVMLPLYDDLGAEWKKQMVYQGSVNVSLGWRLQEAEIYTLTHENILYYFIANAYYFSRKGIYGYYDDGERFVYFSHAVMEALSQLDFTPDILHAHDWQASISVALAHIKESHPGMKTVITIHNLKYQGIMPLDVFDNFFNLPREHLAGFEWNGMFNCLKSALFHADKITTVSPTYAEEIKQAYFGEGLDSLLRERTTDVVGIVNGIDTTIYNPQTDSFLPVPYTRSAKKKAENKVALQQRLDLPVNQDIPVFVIITRLVEQKGIHLLQAILDEFLQEDVQFILLGTGEEVFEYYFAEKEKHYSEQLRALLTFDEGLAHHLYGAADFFLMPSQFEPCGLSQLISLRYMTVPIVRETGGLKDTVFPFNEITGEGNGFSFANYNAHELLDTLRYSLAIYERPKEWKQLLSNVIKSQFSWRDSAYEYVALYHRLIP